MRIVSVAFAAAAVLLAVDTMAQGPGGGPGGGRGGRGRPEEITNRTGSFFTDIAGPQADGDKVADLSTVDLVRAGTSAGQLVVLYIVDGSDDQDVREQFERQVLGTDEVGLELRCFHCGRIDLSKEATLKAKLGKQAPLFVVFGKDGKADEVSMGGYKGSASALQKALEKAAGGVIKPSLAGFAKEYGNLVRDLEQLLGKKKQAGEQLARAGADKQKRAEIEKEQKALEGEEKKLLDKEKDLLGRNRLPERGATAQRLGSSRWGRGREGQGGGRGGAPN